MTDKLVFAFAVLSLCLFAAPGRAGDEKEASRAEARRLMTEGNYREAAVLYRSLALDEAVRPRDAAGDLENAFGCLMNAGLHAEAASLLDVAEKTRGGGWRVAMVVAAFRQRGGLPAREDAGGFGRRNGDERDRVLNLRLLLAAEKTLDAPEDPAAEAERLRFYDLFAGVVLGGREHRLAWRLTGLTDLDVLPDLEAEHVRWSRPQRDAPTTPEGEPLYYPAPASWEAAENDGQRWRWLLGRMAALGTAGREQADMLWGEFLLGQFGVQTLAMGAPLSEDADVGGETGSFAVRTLGEDETIARLATGVKRFAMPDEFNHILVLRRLTRAEDPILRSRALSLLAGVFENRQQYPRAVSFWEALLADESSLDRPSAESALARIVGANGVLQPGDVAPAGSPTTLSFLFRNGRSVSLVATRLDEGKLLRDIRRLVKSGSEDLLKNYYMRRPETLGRFVVEQGLDEYLGEKVAAWDVPLSPLPDHYSSRARIELPFSGAGCYLVEATMRGGNTSRLFLWISDLVLVSKTVGSRQILYVADAADGVGIPATVSFTGYRAQYRDSSHRILFETDDFAVKTDADGLAVVAVDRMRDKQWLTVAETDDGRLAYLGFDSVWPVPVDQERDANDSVFVITDRPAYRPGQDINFKIWRARTSYGRDADPARGEPIPVIVANPNGDTVYEKVLTADEYGGVADSFALSETDLLGGYYLRVPGVPGGVSFRLEEYKKPEFEVRVDAPEEALVLGDAVQIKIRADYYYGAPVTDAAVAYKIVRTPHERSWLPPWRWDWLYGAGSWRSEYDYSWYPGWGEWGCVGPRPPWMPFVFHQPEVVADGEGRLDADGVLRVSLDTASAKELYGHQDHSYEITAEVTDRSRRTIVGTGRVVAARKPFSVAVWGLRGYHDVGDDMRFDVKAMLPLGGGVAARGVAVLHKISYASDGTPSETAAGSWDVETDGSGQASLRLKAGAAGQYRLSCVMRDGAGNSVEGAALFTVRGAAGEGDFRFTALELVPDKREYRPGETLRLAVNSEKKSGVVLLLPRAERAGAGGDDSARPRVLRLENGSRIVDIPVRAADQPNFFCEAVTVFDGRVHSETREIFVPPADRALNVEVVPDGETYAPGAEAGFTVRITDADGRPVAGQVAISVYDRSVEYISGGSNVGDIRAHFWSWKRHYNGAISNSLNKVPRRIFMEGDVQWEPIGIFGGREADWNDDAVYVNGRIDAGSPRNRMMARAAMPVMPRPEVSYMVDADTDLERIETDYYAPPAAPAPAGGMAIAQAATGGDEAEAVVRSEFADTAFWTAALVADEDGVASLRFAMPENLTAWKARAWVMGDAVRVGDGQTVVETRKNVVVRPQAPRFLTQKDRVVLSANLHNYLPRAKSARAELMLEGGLLEPAPGVELSKTVELAAGGEARVDWLVDALRPGEARVVMKLLTDEESDAAEIRLPVVVHGARRVESFGGVIRGDETETVIRFRVPEERLPDQSRLELSFSPSIASAMLEALPFLVEYPHGCTEQTLNRFLPAVTARRFLERTGTSLADARAAVESAPDDAASKQWRERWGDPRAKARPSPVFDDKELEAMVRLGVERLTAMRNADGGWGWFSGAGERSWPHTTAVVVHGLVAARENGAAVPMWLVDEGVAWLRRYRDEQIRRLKIPADAEDKLGERKARADNLDAFVHMILAERDRFSPDMRDFLYRDRLDLSLTGLSMLGIALHAEKATNALEMVLRNLGQFVDRNEEIGAAWLRTSGGWWWWYNDSVETQAWYLKLLSRTDPRGADASGVAKHLLANRKNGSYWRSTRDTAYAIEALAEYALASGETEPDMTAELFLDGRSVMRRRLSPSDALADNRFALEGLAVEPGEHELRLVRSGKGNLYYGGRLDLFSLEDPVAKAGLELKVDRVYYRLTRDDAAVDMATSSGRAEAGRVERYSRERLPGPFDGAGFAGVASGDLIEVELTVEAANDYEYLVFEDMKAAGCEAVELRSGYTANALGAYVEYRDRKVVLFVRHLPRGTYTLNYRFRAEVPGSFSALPVFGGGMYATDLFANSDEMKLRIEEEGVYDGGRE